MRTCSGRTTATMIAAGAAALLLVSASTVRAWTAGALPSPLLSRRMQLTPSFSGSCRHHHHDGRRSRCVRPVVMAHSVADVEVDTETFEFVEKSTATAVAAATADEESARPIPNTSTTDIAPTSSFDASSSAAAAALLQSPGDSIDYEELGKKVLNGLILAVSFGYAAYTIFNIDHGMTRGWTQSEIAMRIPLDNWNNYETSLAEKPIYTKTLINVVIYLLGDWLSQTVFQKKNVLDFDPWRVLRNGLIGLGFGPLVHEYYQFSDHILPPGGGMMIRLEKILMDQTLYLTVKCSMYILAVGLLSGDDFDTCKTRVKDRIGGIVVTAWKFWPLVHCVTYSLIPARHRILWVSSVDLVWNAILASMTNTNEGDAVDEELVTDTILEEGAAEGVHDPFKLTQELVPQQLALFTNEDELSVHAHPTVEIEGEGPNGGNSTMVAVAP